MKNKKEFVPKREYKLVELYSVFLDIAVLYFLVCLISFLVFDSTITKVIFFISCLTYVVGGVMFYVYHKRNKTVFVDENYLFNQIAEINRTLYVDIPKALSKQNNSDRSKVINIKYSSSDMPKLGNIEGKKSDWIDLYTNEEIELKNGEFKLIDLGVAMELPDDTYEAIVIPRSSTFKKYGILQANSVGLIDNSYCGNNDIWKFPAYATKDIIIPKFERICQFRIQKKMPNVLFAEVENLDNLDRGGFGSTDKV